MIIIFFYILKSFRSNTWLVFSIPGWLKEFYRRITTFRTSIFLFACFGIYCYYPFLNQCCVRKQILTSNNITGTSMRTPITVANAAPEESPKSTIETAIATSKWLLAPICADGAASSYCKPIDFADRYVNQKMNWF